MDMTGKTILITGASRGIGAEAARVFAMAGANVGLLARSGNKVEALAADLGDRAFGMACDVADYAQVDAGVRACVDKFGGLDVLINNAGVVEPISHMDTADPAGWGHAIDINLKGVFYGMRAALPVMIAAGGGTVLTVSSGAAHSPMEGWSHYCASKAGAAMLTRCVDAENRDDGIRAPGDACRDRIDDTTVSRICDWSDRPADRSRKKTSGGILLTAMANDRRKSGLSQIPNWP